MARRQAEWVLSASEFQLAAGTNQKFEIGNDAQSHFGVASLGGWTVVRLLINLTWQADALAADFDPCFAGIVGVTEVASTAGVGSLPDPELAGGGFMWRDHRFIPRVGSEISAVPVYGAFAHMVSFDIRSARKMKSEHTLVFIAGCTTSDYDLGWSVNALWLRP